MKIFAKNIFALAGTVLQVSAASAQSYSIDTFTVAGGSGTVTGGPYSISGTVGQPDASLALTGGNFSLTGGFWSLYAVQTPAVPLLSIERQGADLRVFWPLPADGILLDESLDLTGVWSQVSFPYSTNATDISISVPAPAENRFYRLRKP